MLVDAHADGFTNTLFQKSTLNGLSKNRVPFRALLTSRAAFERVCLVLGWANGRAHVGGNSLLVKAAKMVILCLAFHKYLPLPLVQHVPLGKARYSDPPFLQGSRSSYLQAVLLEGPICRFACQLQETGKRSDRTLLHGIRQTPHHAQFQEETSLNASGMDL